MSGQLIGPIGVLPAVVVSSFAQGIFFNSTGGLTPPTNYDQETGTTTNYPRVTAQGNNVGWDSLPAGVTLADRTTPTDVRLRGIAFVSNSNIARYRIDLPSAGTYKIRLAMGDVSPFSHPQRIQILDNGSVVLSGDLNPGTIAADQYLDATGVTRTSVADWVANNAIFTVNFTSTIAQFQIGLATGGTDNSTLNAIFIST